MSIEAEFVVNIGQYEHVKLTLSGKDLEEARDESPSMTFEEWLGDYWASLKAAVLYGRDQALKGVESRPLTPAVNVPEETREDPVKLLTEELGATVLEVHEEPQEAPSGPSVGDTVEVGGMTFTKKSENPFPEEEKQSSRPWKNKPATKKKPKAWEDPVTEGPDATPEESVTATKAARKAASAGDWDW